MCTQYLNSTLCLNSNIFRYVSIEISVIAIKFELKISIVETKNNAWAINPKVQLCSLLVSLSIEIHRFCHIQSVPLLLCEICNGSERCNVAQYFIDPSVHSNKNENIYFTILIVTIRKHHNPLIINKPEHEI